MTNWPQQSAAADFYGANLKITKGVAGPDPVWEKANLVTVALPWKAVASWDRTISIKSLRVHRLVAESLTRVLNRIWEAFGRSQKAIEAAGMHLIGGGYNWRQMRGKARLSMHALGCAVDFDPARNGLGDPTPEMDQRVVEAFEVEGWVWGGRWSPQSRDGMHFQAAIV
ncbi:M15 family metallopeptidase [Agrobacterium vitis]|uniref:M15 family metallopeptidase n=1 Tax=Agrobacterium vitis TaxID=373 RepID=UPI0012E7359F|nr:M15 family metallopeptidase [Agrobacterium vitis]MVA24526.1 M15 family peptidase [Agrobacterium vitis]